MHRRLTRIQTNWRFCLVLTVTAILCPLVLEHVHDVNGPWYWKWPWRRLPIWPTYPLVGLAASPIFASRWLARKRPRSVLPTILLLMLGSLLLQLACCVAQPLGTGRVAAIIENSSITSYYMVASRLNALESTGVTTADWMAAFPDVLAAAPVHARFKPPGLILYHLLAIKLFGSGAATAAGLGIALLATAAIPATFLLARAFQPVDARDDSAAVAAATCMSLCPAFMQFFPQFDQLYPAVLCGLILLWCRALRSGRSSTAVAFGLLLWVSTMMSYILLSVGAFLIAWTLLQLLERRPGLLTIAIRQAAVAMITVTGLYLALYRWTGFDPILAYQTISRLQQADIVAIHRPFPVHIVFDLLDFCLGLGWIGVALAVLSVHRSGLRSLRSRPAQFTLLAALQIGVFIGGAFLPAESARLFMLFMPLVFIIAGFELACWPAWQQTIVYAAMTLVAAVYLQNLVFINLGEHLPDHQIGVPDSQGHVAFE